MYCCWDWSLAPETGSTHRSGRSSLGPIYRLGWGGGCFGWWAPRGGSRRDEHSVRVGGRGVEAQLPDTRYNTLSNLNFKKQRIILFKYVPNPNSDLLALSNYLLLVLWNSYITGHLTLFCFSAKSGGPSRREGVCRWVGVVCVCILMLSKHKAWFSRDISKPRFLLKKHRKIGHI